MDGKRKGIINHTSFKGLNGPTVWEYISDRVQAGTLKPKRKIYIMHTNGVPKRRRYGSIGVDECIFIGTYQELEKEYSGRYLKPTQNRHAAIKNMIVVEAFDKLGHAFLYHDCLYSALNKRHELAKIPNLTYIYIEPEAQRLNLFDFIEPQD